MTTIDGVAGRWRTWLPGVSQGPAEALAEARGCTVPEAVADAVIDAYMALPSAHSVDAGELPPERPEGGPGQGEAQPPAPGPALLIYRHPIVHIHIDGGPCVFGEDCGR